MASNKVQGQGTGETWNWVLLWRGWEEGGQSWGGGRTPDSWPWFTEELRGDPTPRQVDWWEQHGTAWFIGHTGQHICLPHISLWFTRNTKHIIIRSHIPGNGQTGEEEEHAHRTDIQSLVIRQYSNQHKHGRCTDRHRDTSMTWYGSGGDPSKMDEELGKYRGMTWPRTGLRNQHKHIKNMQRVHKQEGLG